MISREDLEALVTLTCKRHHDEAPQYQWACQSIQTLVLELLKKERRAISKRLCKKEVPGTKQEDTAACDSDEAMTLLPLFEGTKADSSAGAIAPVVNASVSIPAGGTSVPTIDTKPTADSSVDTSVPEAAIDASISEPTIVPESTVDTNVLIADPSVPGSTVDTSVPESASVPMIEPIADTILMIDTSAPEPNNAIVSIVDTSVATSVPEPNTDTSVSVTDTSAPEPTSVPIADTSIPADTSVPIVDTSVPDDASFPIADTSILADTSVPIVDTSIPADTSVPIDTSVPDDASVPIVDTSTPADTSVPIADTSIPANTSVPIVDTSVPDDASVPIVDISIPADTSVHIADTSIPADTSVPIVDTSVPADTSVPIVDTSALSTVDIVSCKDPKSSSHSSSGVASDSDIVRSKVPAYSKGVDPQVYASSIISGTLDQRIASSIGGSLEHQLQTMSFTTYVNVLTAIQQATPITVLGNHDDLSSDSPDEDEWKVSSMFVLLCVLEKMMHDKVHLLPSVDRARLLHFWNEVCHITFKGTKKIVLFAFRGPKASQILKPGPFSSATFSGLLEEVLTVVPSDPALFHYLFSLLRYHTKVLHKINEGPLRINKQLFVSAITKCCTMHGSSPPTQLTQNTLFYKFLVGMSHLKVMDGDRAEEGIHLLMLTLVQILQQRYVSTILQLHHSLSPPPRSPSDIYNQYLYTLVKVLSKASTLALIFDSSDHAHTIDIVKAFISCTIGSILANIDHTLQPPFTIHGAVAEGRDKARRFHYSSVASSSTLKWVELKADKGSSSNDNGLSGDLLSMLQCLVGASLPQHYIEHLSEQLHHYSVPNMPLLDLMYNDKHQLSCLIRTLSSSHKPASQSLLTQFISLLQSNCCDFSCFRTPLLEILDECSETYSVAQSQFLLQLVSQFALGTNSAESATSGMMETVQTTPTIDPVDRKLQLENEILEFIKEGMKETKILIVLTPSPQEVQR